MSSYPINQMNNLADALEKLGFIIPNGQADDNSYSVGQMAQLAKKFKSIGLTSEDITKLGQHSDLYGLRGILNGTHRVVPIEKAVKKAVETAKVYLRDLYPGEDIELGPDDGVRELANAESVFLHSDPDFGAIRSSKQPAKKVRVCEIIDDGKFVNIFGSALGISSNKITPSEFVKKHREDLRKICVGQGQVEDFAVKHRDKLRKDSCDTFFLIEDEATGDFFVVSVYFSDDGLSVDVNWFECSFFWNAVFRHRLVIPWMD